MTAWQKQHLKTWRARRCSVYWLKQTLEIDSPLAEKSWESTWLWKAHGWAAVGTSGAGGEHGCPWIQTRALPCWNRVTEITLVRVGFQSHCWIESFSPRTKSSLMGERTRAWPQRPWPCLDSVGYPPWEHGTVLYPSDFQKLLVGNLETLWSDWRRNEGDFSK